jgi:hypothetical protein
VSQDIQVGQPGPSFQQDVDTGAGAQAGGDGLESWGVCDLVDDLDLHLQHDLESSRNTVIFYAARA